ncbi:hypothetical protein D3C72_1130520 [compost metagenome]
MRVDFMREGIHRQLEYVFAVALRQALNSELIAFGQRFANFLVGLAGQFEVQLVIFDFGIPQAVQFGLVFRPRRFAAVEIDSVVAGEAHWLFQQRQCIGITLKTAFLRQIVQRVWRIQLTAFQLFAKLVALVGELRHVGGQQHVMVVVQHIQVTIEDLA